VFSSGYLANLAIVTALTAALSGGGGGGDGGGAGVLIVSDERNHASLVDACRLARRPGVRVLVTPHGDAAAVEAALARREERAAIVVTDAVFSVAGDVAPVAALHAAARRHGRCSWSTRRTRSACSAMGPRRVLGHGHRGGA